MIVQVQDLGGEVCESHNYEAQCTHILCEKPSRGEKIFSGIAGGKWVLSTKYVEACTAVGYFLDVSWKITLLIGEFL
jgi:topoisomerase (DNA) II binding protein 1